MDSPNEIMAVSWHTLSTRDLLAAVAADEGGLTGAEAAKRLEIFGPNRLPQKPPPTWWEIGLRQFRSPLIYILGVAALVSLLTWHLEDALFIGAVLVLNAVIGGYQEWRAEQSSRALQKLLHVRATIQRDGEMREIDAEGVVPGDVVWLESGNRVPADLRLLTVHGLEVDESLLTGESLSVLKNPAWTGEAGTPLGDRLSMAYAGSIVTRGRSKSVVVATGTKTAVGQLALDVLGSAGGKAPLLERMEKFTHAVAYAVLGAATLIGIFGVMLRGYTVSEMFLFAVALAVSAIPEGLPVALTVALAIATTRMARCGVIVRRLAAVEGLGSCTLIASDKTGTLTCNELTVREIQLPNGGKYAVTGEGFEPNGEVLFEDQAVVGDRRETLGGLARAAVLCNEGTLHQHGAGWTWRGDPTDLALLSFGYKLGFAREPMLERHLQVNDIPFESERQYAATFNAVNEEIHVFIKGAPEKVLAMCIRSEADRRMEGLRDAAESMAERGMRVLAFAEGVLHKDLERERTPPEPTDLEFLGFVGMIDPLRPGAREAVAACQEAGITVCMVTGDHPATALAIARDLGFADRPEQVVTGRDLEGKSKEELIPVVKHARVFARTSPRQKLELVEAARAAGHFVAVTGDGVNDAPALRAANIGVAMGLSGTDVAREAAELVIADDNFATIVSGVEQGRAAYDNVRKVIYLLISTGAAEVIMLGLAVLTGWPSTEAGLVLLPLLPVQLLWLNLVTNGIQDVALAFEPSEGDVLRRRPRPPRERIFDRLMLERTMVAAVVIALVGFGAFYVMIDLLNWPETQARNTLLLLMVLFENVHIANCRSETKSAFRMSLLTSPILLTGTLIAFSVHMVSMQLPLMQRFLHIEPVDLATFASMLGLALTVLVAMEIQKWLWRVRSANRSQ